MFGILNINKPPGLTSRDVVNRVQRLVRPHKVGHAGTLDPLATGVLVVGVGPATKLVEYVQRMPKRYVGAFLLGRQSDTEDVEGQVEMLDDPPEPTREMIDAVLPQFIGTIQQRPPIYSALKVKGQRAYKLARAGEAVEVQPREIEVHALQLVAYEYPRLTLDVTCGSGTYIRSLGRDIAEAVGTAAVMEQLQRTAIGEFSVDEALSLEPLVDATAVQQRLLSPLTALTMLPKIVVDDAEIANLVNGRAIEGRDEYAEDELLAVNGQGQLVAVLQHRTDGRLGTVKNFAHLL